MASEEKIIGQPIGDEMRASYLDYAMSVIVSRALPDVRDGLKPVQRRILYGASEMGLAPDRRAQEVRAARGRCHGPVPPARGRPGVRSPRAHGPGLQLSLPADRRAGQLRERRRRPAGGDAVHRGAPLAHGARTARRHRPGDRGVHSQLRPVAPGAGRPAQPRAEPVDERRDRHRGRYGDQHPAAQSRRAGRRAHAA